MGRKGFAPIIIVLAVVAILAIGGGVWYYEAHRSNASKPTDSSMTETTITGTIQAIQDTRSVDGGLVIKVGGIWIGLGGGMSLPGTQEPIGKFIGIDFDHMDNNIGKKVEVYGLAYWAGNQENMTIVGSSSYYIKAVQ